MIQLQNHTETERLTRIMAGMNEQLAAGNMDPDNGAFKGLVDTWEQTFRAGQNVMALSPAIIGVPPEFSRCVSRANVPRLGGACLRIEGTIVDNSIAVVETLGHDMLEIPRRLRALMPNDEVDMSYKGPLIVLQLLTREAKNVVIPISTPSTKRLANGTRHFIPTLFQAVVSKPLQ